MTLERAAAPGPRTDALKHPTPITSRRRAGLLALAVVLAVVAVACGGTNPPGSPHPSTVGLPAASGSPVAVGSPGSGASGNPDPSPPRWPGTTVLAVIALGAADGEIEKAGVDLQAAADKQDLKAMWGAADGLAKMIDGLMPNLDRLEVYAGTTDVSRIYRQSFPELSGGAKQLRDSITGGDANGVVAGSQLIAKGLADYAPVRVLIAGLVEQAIVQQRLYLK
jgi:hypothetical protein